MSIEKESGRCQWEYDDTHCKWDTDCGEAFQFSYVVTDITEEFSFCPYCGWQVVNAESEDDECEYDCDSGVINRGDTVIKCPDCTDSDDDYDEPKVEDKEHDSRLANFLRELAEKTVNIGSSGESKLNQCADLIEAHWELLDDYDNLEAENEELRESLNEWKFRWMQRGTKLTEFQNERDNLQNRIEEAREELSEAVACGDPFANKIDRILSEDGSEDE